MPGRPLGPAGCALRDVLKRTEVSESHRAPVPCGRGRACVTPKNLQQTLPLAVLHRALQAPPTSEGAGGVRVALSSFRHTAKGVGRPLPLLAAGDSVPATRGGEKTTANKTKQNIVQYKRTHFHIVPTTYTHTHTLNIH